MSKIITFLLVFAFFVSEVAAQKIKYENSLAAAKKSAFAAQKPLAILITMPQTRPVNMAIYGWNDTEVLNKFNAHFINYKVEAKDSTGINLIRSYRITRFPSLLFLDPQGGLMFTDLSIPLSQQLLEIADKAIEFKREKSLVYFDSVYNSGTKTTAFLKEYITRRSNSGITDNADLIEKYVSGLNIADLNNYEEVLFILKAGPILDSNAYKLARTNRYLVDSIYKSEPLATRTAINNATIQNSMRNAIDNKNLTKAHAVAAFTRSSHGKDYQEGQKAFSVKLIQYYQGVKDTVNYLQHASVYYDRYYMSMTIDSVRKRDSLNYEFAKQRASQNAIATLPKNTRDTVIRRIVSVSYTKDAYSTALNNIAWNFYKMARNNNEHLFKALMWSKRAIEFSPQAGFYDTYAHLLYSLKFYDEAESMQKKAIELAKAGKADSTVYESEYKKIKSRTL